MYLRSVVNSLSGLFLRGGAAIGCSFCEMYHDVEMIYL